MVEQALEVRAVKGREIAQMDDQVRRLDDTTYKVRSQSGKAIYEVVSTERGWVCQCPDYRYRAMKCKHIWAVEFSAELRREIKRGVIVAPITVQACPRCNSQSIKKGGIRHNRHADIQKYRCKECDYWFTVNLGFEGMHATPQIITSAMQLYFSGASFRKVQEFLKLQGVSYSHQSVYNWVQKYVALMERYVERLTPKVGNAWRADEIFIKFHGEMKYVFALMDDESRFWIAQQVATNKGVDDVKPMFREGAAIAGKNPKVIITDGAHNYIDAARAFSTPQQRVSHIREIRLTGIVHNNKMERMNGEIRDREKVMRSLKNEGTPILKGMQIYHNYIRPHMALSGRTPAEAAGITVEGDNKWLTLIQNASMVKRACPTN